MPHLLRVFLLTTVALVAAADDAGNAIRHNTTISSPKVSEACSRINAGIERQISQGALDEAQHSLFQALNGDARSEPICAGLLFNNVAAGLEIAGRLDQAVQFAEKSITYFQQGLPDDDPAYLPAFNILASALLAKGFIGRTREVLLQMQRIHTTNSHDRVLILCIGGNLFQREGKTKEAESDYTRALSAISGTGLENSTEAATVRVELATVYIEDQRYQDAAVLLDTGLAILSRARDAVPLDRVNLLNTRAILRVHQNHWKEAESDLAEAAFLCRQQPQMDLAELEPILNNYAFVLRKVRRKNARAVEAWAAAIREAKPASPQVIDVTELSAERASSAK